MTSGTAGDVRGAGPTIEEALNEFLANERKRLGDKTFRQYEIVVTWFGLCIGNYGHNYLSKTDHARQAEWENETSGPRKFNRLFGPRHALRLYDEFLGHFMVRKVSTAKSTIRSAGTVLRRASSLPASSPRSSWADSSSRESREAGSG